VQNRLHELAQSLDRVVPSADAVDHSTANFTRKSLARFRCLQEVTGKHRAALLEVKNIIGLLNTSLNRPIGSSRYFIEHRRSPEFEIYHQMLDATATAGSDLFASIADQELRDRIGEFLELLVQAPNGVEAARLLDYRHYYDYDVAVEDQSQPPDPTTGLRHRISVDKQSGKFSGGENQSPYFIAILASYLRAYRRHDRYRDAPTLSLVPIDEAFSKLSGERIADCIDALAQLDLQGMFSMSTATSPMPSKNVITSSLSRRRNAESVAK
jgi:uncharacterized protein YPO0396